VGERVLEQAELVDVGVGHDVGARGEVLPGLHPEALQGGDGAEHAGGVAPVHPGPQRVLLGLARAAPRAPLPWPLPPRRPPPPRTPARPAAPAPARSARPSGHFFVACAPHVVHPGHHRRTQGTSHRKLYETFSAPQEEPQARHTGNRGAEARYRTRGSRGEKQASGLVPCSPGRRRQPW